MLNGTSYLLHISLILCQICSGSGSNGIIWTNYHKNFSTTFSIQTFALNWLENHWLDQLFKKSEKSVAKLFLSCESMPQNWYLTFFSWGEGWVSCNRKSNFCWHQLTLWIFFLSSKFSQYYWDKENEIYCYLVTFGDAKK